MKSIIEELWSGNIYSDVKRSYSKEEADRLMNYIADHHRNLHESLNDQQKELFEKFDDCRAELNSINEREMFVYAFSLGARIAFEVMSFNIE